MENTLTLDQELELELNLTPEQEQELEFAKKLREYTQYLFVPTSCMDAVYTFTDEELKTIHPNVNVSKEMLLKFLSYLTSTFFSGNRTKCLYSRSLNKALRIRVAGETPVRYKKVINLLIKKGLIEKTKNYSTATKKSNEYAITEKYYDFKISKYLPKTTIGRKDLVKYNILRVENLMSSPIAISIFKQRERYTFPSVGEMKNNLRKEIENGYVNSKGKKLIFLDGRDRLDYPDYVFAEDYLAKYVNARDNYLLPIVSDSDTAGGRVYSVYNMMSKVMRKYILIDGERTVELDFSALHPNIANMIYGDGSNTGMISHDIIAKDLNMDRADVKKAHLSFFNLKAHRFVKGETNNHQMVMEDSILYDFYVKKNPKLIQNIMMDKLENGSNITSRKMFQVETKLMTNIIRELDSLGIGNIYVFDALLVPESKMNDVREIMNRNAKELRINTSVP